MQTRNKLKSVVPDCIINEMQHYENMPMQYTAIFHGCKNDNFQLIFFAIFIFLLKTYNVGTRLNHLNKAVVTSTHNVCFRAKIRK